MGRTVAVLLAIFTIFWLNRPSKFDWKPHDDDVEFKSCPDASSEVHFLFGGTSMLGKYIVQTWKRDFPNVCLINYNRRECEGCDVSYTGDIRDTRYIRRLLEHHGEKITHVVYSIKPALEFTDYKTFIEVNFNAIVETTKIVKEIGVPTLLYTSSIACSNHYVSCHYCSEETKQPLLTEYEAPYDLSKRLAEDFILDVADDGFKTASLRVSGIMGGVGDPYFHHRSFPFILTFTNPVIVDYNYAKNIADALAEMTRALKTPSKAGKVSGKYFYYTGEHITEHEVAHKLVELTGKPLLSLPLWSLGPLLDFWQWFRWTHDYYTILDLMRMSNVEETFDQTLFHSTFPDFKPKYTVLEAVTELYGKKDVNNKEDL